VDLHEIYKDPDENTVLELRFVTSTYARRPCVIGDCFKQCVYLFRPIIDAYEAGCEVVCSLTKTILEEEESL
jgi:hypothetical protein